MIDTARVLTMVYDNGSRGPDIRYAWFAETNPQDMVIVFYGNASWPSQSDRVWYFGPEA